MPIQKLRRTTDSMHTPHCTPSSKWVSVHVPRSFPEVCAGAWEPVFTGTAARCQAGRIPRHRVGRAMAWGGLPRQRSGGWNDPVLTSTGMDGEGTVEGAEATCAAWRLGVRVCGDVRAAMADGSGGDPSGSPVVVAFDSAER